MLLEGLNRWRVFKVRLSKAAGAFDTGKGDGRAYPPVRALQEFKPLLRRRKKPRRAYNALPACKAIPGRDRGE